MSRAEMSNYASSAVASFVSPFVVRRRRNAQRTAHRTAKALAATGAAVGTIAQRTGLPRDVVAMLIAGCTIPAAAPRKNVPAPSTPTAASAARLNVRSTTLPTGQIANRLKNNNLQIGNRGTGVALA